MNYECLQMQGDNVLVKIIEAEREALKNGIYLPHQDDKKYQEGKVIAVSLTGESDLVNFNYTVIFRQHVGYDLGNGYKVIDKKEVLGKILHKECVNDKQS